MWDAVMEQWGGRLWVTMASVHSLLGLPNGPRTQQCQRSAPLQIADGDSGTGLRVSTQDSLCGAPCLFPAGRGLSGMVPRRTSPGPAHRLEGPQRIAAVGVGSTRVGRGCKERQASGPCRPGQPWGPRVSTPHSGDTVLVPPGLSGASQPHTGTGDTVTAGAQALTLLPPSCGPLGQRTAGLCPLQPLPRNPGENEARDGQNRGCHRAVQTGLCPGTPDTTQGSGRASGQRWALRVFPAAAGRWRRIPGLRRGWCGEGGPSCPAPQAWPPPATAVLEPEPLGALAAAASRHTPLCCSRPTLPSRPCPAQAPSP